MSVVNVGRYTDLHTDMPVVNVGRYTDLHTGMSVVNVGRYTGLHTDISVVHVGLLIQNCHKISNFCPTHRNHSAFRLQRPICSPFIPVSN